MTFEPPDNLLCLKVEDRDDAIESAHGEVVAGMESARVEAGAERGGVDGRVETLGDRSRERVCGGSWSAYFQCA